MEVVAEDDVLDQHTLDLDTPSGCDIFDDFTDRLCNLLTALDNVLKHASTNDVSQSSLGTLDKRLSDVADTEGGLMRRNDVIVDDGSEIQGNVVLGHADLARHLDNLNLDIDLNEAFTERIDLDETWVDGAIEPTEFCDQTDVSLRHWLVRIGADETAGDGAHEADAATKGIDCENISIESRERMLGTYSSTHTSRESQRVSRCLRGSERMMVVSLPCAEAAP